MCNHTKIVCPEHDGGFDCTPFCRLCEGDQEFCPSCEVMTNEHWEKIYLPMTNHLTNEGLSYETYGDELDYVTQQDERHVWTELDGDNGVYIVSGMHYVNRIQYYITNKPWNDGDNICITVCEYIDCDCYDGDVDPKNNCPECGGTGSKTVWSD